MKPAPLRPAHTALVIVASFLVAGALLPWGDRARIVCSAGAVAIVVALCVLRLREHTPSTDAAEPTADERLVASIRARRAARMRRRP